MMRGIGALAAPLVLVLGACATEAPRPPLMSPIAQTQEFGYSERDLAGSQVEVSYLGPTYRVSTSGDRRQEAVARARQQAEDLALWRAAQIARAYGKPAFEVTDRRADVLVEIRDQVDPYPFGWPPIGYSRYGWPRYPYYSTFPPTVWRDAYAQADVTLTVELLEKSRSGAHSAAEIIDRMSKLYGPPAPTGTAPPAGDAPPPSDAPAPAPSSTAPQGRT